LSVGLKASDDDAGYPKKQAQMTSKAAPQAPSAALVQDPSTLVAVLKRLRATNDGIVFWNRQRTFRLMLRNDPADLDDSIACELVLLFDEDDDAMSSLMELSGEGYQEETGTWVLEQWAFRELDLDSVTVSKVAEAINRAYLTTVCACSRYLIKDDGMYCVFCQMTATPADKAAHFCPICHEQGAAMHMARLPCCGQRLHRQCLHTWRQKSRDERCPMCRQPAGV
jgi:hypothetical protein